MTIQIAANKSKAPMICDLEKRTINPSGSAVLGEEHRHRWSKLRSRVNVWRQGSSVPSRSPTVREG